MKRTTQRAGLLKVVALLLLFTGLASANALLVPTGIDWNRGGSLWIKQDGQEVYAGFVGVILVTVTENGQQFYRDTFCADLFTPIYLSTDYNTSLLWPDQVPGKSMDRVSWLVDNALLPTYDSSYPSELKKQNWVTNSAKGMGLQLAIWDLTSDGGDGFSAGRVQASTKNGSRTDQNVLVWANRYLDWSSGKSSNLAYIYENVQLSNDVPAQMLVGPMFEDGGPAPPPASQVPEPSTLGLGSAATLAIVASVRRKNRQKQAA